MHRPPRPSPPDHEAVPLRRAKLRSSHLRRTLRGRRASRAGRGGRPRLEGIVHHLGLALGGRPGASFAKRLMLPVSNDTLLRVVRRQARRPSEPLSVVGVDDWAFRRNHRYGSIVCDLERRRVVALLPDREVATLQAWLAGHPGITTVSRDRGGGYGEAVARALPLAIQVADRWHLRRRSLPVCASCSSSDPSSSRLESHTSGRTTSKGGPATSAIHSPRASLGLFMSPPCGISGMEPDGT